MFPNPHSTQAEVGRKSAGGRPQTRMEVGCTNSHTHKSNHPWGGQASCQDRHEHVGYAKTHPQARRPCHLTVPAGPTKIDIDVKHTTYANSHTKKAEVGTRIGQGGLHFDTIVRVEQLFPRF